MQLSTGLMNVQSDIAAFYTQVASVVGTTFTAGLLAAVHPMAREATDLQSDLAALAELRFVRRDDTAADAWCWCQVSRYSCFDT